MAIYFAITAAVYLKNRKRATFRKLFGIGLATVSVRLRRLAIELSVGTWHLVKQVAAVFVWMPRAACSVTKVQASSGTSGLVAGQY